MKADEVAHYLQNNPQFFEHYADLMAQIAIPHPHSGRAISITERQMLALRDKNRQLEAKLIELIGFGEDNDAISEKMQRLSVALITAYTFQAVIHTLGYHLKEDFAIPQVAVRLWTLPPGERDELPEFAAVSQELQVFAETLTHPVLRFHVRFRNLHLVRRGVGQYPFAGADCVAGRRRHYRHDCPRRL